MHRNARSLVWFRRDLRDFDHAALHAALRESGAVHCAFVFDRDILEPLPDRCDRRVEFIRDSVVELDGRLRAAGGALLVRDGRAREVIPRLAAELGVDAVYANHDYEPQAVARDAAVAKALADQQRDFRTTKDQVVFERDEIVAQSGRPFSVFTPYKHAWLKALLASHLAPYPVDDHANALARPPASMDGSPPTLETLGFKPTNLRSLAIAPGMTGGAARFADFQQRIDDYANARDYPAIKGPSYLSVDLRFGTVSIRQLAAYAHVRSLHPGGEGAASWLSELIWRDFYAQILWHHPRVVDRAFRPEYEALPFRNDRGQFARWCAGETGYPIVDAAMRQLNQTGYMHNRLRMIAASFLVKDLLIDWRWGERYFADKLNDYDLASNNGGWQWAASTGCDAQPYFRIFNPVTQSKRFDAHGDFIRRYVPELAALDAAEIHAPWQLSADAQRSRGVCIGRDYPSPIVDHAQARMEALALFASARKT
ncbi:MAG: deoxyribodipyrimidine photo-lyase [Betaproteobacteria bacterium]